MAKYSHDGNLPEIQAPSNSKVVTDADFAIGDDHAGSDCAWQPIGEIVARLVENAVKKNGEWN